MDIKLPSGKIIKVLATAASFTAPWNPSGDAYKVKVLYNGKYFTFRFWDSVSNRGNNPDLRGAVACWAMDVWTGINANDALDIYDEFGYSDVKEARRVFKGVKQAEAQYNRIGMYEEDLQFLSDY